MTIPLPLPMNQILEQKKRLSESLIWQWQRDYFENQGINAWVNQVPFYITSNPFIANCYAKITLRFISDWIKQTPDAKNHPFYIMELGTGSGRFSFYVLKALHELRALYGLENVVIRYVMSDFKDQNLEFYQTHHALAPYLEKGQLDFAHYDMEKEQPIRLILRGITLDEHTLKNPLVVYANYLFDSIAQDIFNVKNSQLNEVRISLSTEKSNLKNDNPIDFEKIHFAYSKKEITQPYYDDPQLNAILDTYRETLQESHFLMPISSIRALNYLKKLSNHKLFFIASDKAYFELEELESVAYPAMVSHGSFSMMVNFHAMSEYIKRTGGSFYSHNSRSNIRTAVSSMGFTLDHFSETTTAIHDSLTEFNPSDYFNLHRHMYASATSCEISTLTSYLLLSKWDPYIFLKMSSHISTVAETLDYKSMKTLADNMSKIAANYYYLPQTECVLFEIGVFYHSLKQYHEALNYYHRAEEFVGEQFGVHFNAALCLYHTKQLEDALVRLKRALIIEPNSHDAKDWIAYIQKLIKN